MSMEEKTLLQAVVVVKAMCRGYGWTPLGVELVEGTSAEQDAWRQEAARYLRAKADRVKWRPVMREYEEFLQ